MLQLYTIFDKKASVYSAPQFYKHVAEATRAIQMHLEEGKGTLARFPADHALYLVGSFDESSGLLYPTAEAGPQFTIEIAELVPQKGN